MKRLISFWINQTARIAPSWNGKFSFRLLCRVQRVGISEQGVQFLDQAEETKLYHDSYQATVYKYGSGPKNVIFLHGWLSNSERWNETVASMDLDHYSCYLIDAPGHGRSIGRTLNLEIYRLFLDQQIRKLSQVHAIVGHSLGSLVTAYAYLHNPALPVNRFVITGAPAGMRSIYDFFERVMHLNKQSMRNLNRHIRNNITTVDPLEISMANFLKTVSTPVLIIHDQEDKICPIDLIEQASQNRKNVDFYKSSGLGHNLKGPIVIENTVRFLGS